MDEVRFAPGDRVRTSSRDPDFHTRLPRYVRGHVGVVVARQGRWELPDDPLGPHELPVEWVYTVRFDARDLWGAGDHMVTVDLWDSYLEHHPEEET